MGLKNPWGVLAAAPLFRRIAWHMKRLARQFDRRFFIQLMIAGVGVVILAGALVTLIEKDLTFSSLVNSFYWSVTTVLGQGDASYVESPGGYVISFLLGLFGVGILTAITGALLGIFIDMLLKEGQGMGASGFRDHIVICGWNSTARDLVNELKTDEYAQKVVLLHTDEKNPAGEGVYFVRGDGSDIEDLKRAGITEASSAIVCPKDGSDEADMHSILTILAIESIAPEVRTVAEVNNPRHVDHFRRAEVDEMLVTSSLSAHLLARSALYPGLSAMVAEIVAGGEGSELYRVVLPEEYAGLTVGVAAARLRAEHQATLMGVCRGEGTFVNPPDDFVMMEGDNVVVVADSLGSLSPLQPAPALDVDAATAALPGGMPNVEPAGG